MSAQGPSWFSNMHKTEWREEGATHIFISSVSELSCTCAEECDLLSGAWHLEEHWGPWDLWASRTWISGENFTSKERIFFLPWLCFSSFSLPLLLFNLWFNILKNGRRYRVKQCCKNEGQLLGLPFANWPPTSFKPIVILLKTKRKIYKGEQVGSLIHPCICIICV